MYNVCVQCIAHCTLYTVLYIVQWTLYIAHCIVHCTLCNTIYNLCVCICIYNQNFRNFAFFSDNFLPPKFAFFADFCCFQVFGGGNSKACLKYAPFCVACNVAELRLFSGGGEICKSSPAENIHPGGAPEIIYNKLRLLAFFLFLFCIFCVVFRGSVLCPTLPYLKPVWATTVHPRVLDSRGLTPSAPKHHELLNTTLPCQWWHHPWIKEW